MKTIKLRPHHILCIQKFTGHGYNAAFTTHMASIVSELTGKCKTQIIVTRGCDDVCQKCPNNAGGVCTSLEKVTLMDKAVLDICGLAYGETVPWREPAHIARERIFETAEFDHICAYCQWFALCRNTEVYHE